MNSVLKHKAGAPSIRRFLANGWKTTIPHTPVHREQQPSPAGATFLVPEGRPKIAQDKRSAVLGTPQLTHPAPEGRPKQTKLAPETNRRDSHPFAAFRRMGGKPRSPTIPFMRREPGPVSGYHLDASAVDRARCPFQNKGVLRMTVRLAKKQAAFRRLAPSLPRLRGIEKAIFLYGPDCKLSCGPADAELGGPGQF
jgi:hypothetical protein